MTTIRNENIYLDNAATTIPCDEAYRELISAAQVYGNPSSPHHAGVEAANVLKSARRRVAAAASCGEDELFFTSCGSESNNTAIFGLAEKNNKKSNVIITTDSEHPSAALPVDRLEKSGYKVLRLKTAGGNLDYDALIEAVKDRVCLVSIMAVNNETGAEYDIPRIREIIDKSGCGALLHCDCVQGFMKTGTDYARYCDTFSVSAHKLNSYKGVGALFIRHGLKIQPYIFGGGQENGMRSGTENIPEIAAFAASCEKWKIEKNQRAEYVSALRTNLMNKLEIRFGTSVKFHLPEKSCSSILSFELCGIKSETALNYLSMCGIYISASSACSTHAKENRVLKAYGLTKEQSESTLRAGLSYMNTEEDTNKLCDALEELIAITTGKNGYKTEKR